MIYKSLTQDNSVNKKSSRNIRVKIIENIVDPDLDVLYGIGDYDVMLFVSLR